MTATCPNGHVSAAEDYCDTCGVPMQSAPAQPYAAQPAPTATPGPPAGGPGSSLDLDAGPSAGGSASGSLACPNCEAPNPPGALFCEACGYDFTTGAMPRGAEPAPSAPSTEPESRSTPSSAQNPPTEPTPTPSSVQNVRPTTPSSAQNPPTEPTPTPSSVQNVRPTTPSSAQDPPTEGAFEWVAEVWVDPDWYGTQEAEDPCPSPGLPTIIPLRKKSLLLGRTSASRNTHPEIELSSDPGVSRRHAQLTTDGARWFVEDLGSSNGTFVGPASGSLPDQPIPVGPKTELSDDDRLYVGAWTRVVVRRATPEEVETFA